MTICGGMHEGKKGVKMTPLLFLVPVVHHNTEF